MKGGGFDSVARANERRHLLVGGGEQRGSELAEVVDHGADHLVCMSGVLVKPPAGVGDADPDVPCLVAGDESLAFGETGEREPLVLTGRQVLGGSRDDAFREQMVGDDRGQELVLV